MRALYKRGSTIEARYSFDRGLTTFLSRSGLKSAKGQCIIPTDRKDIAEELVSTWGFCYIEELSKEEIISFPEMPKLNIDLPLKITPYPYQQEGIAYALEHKRCLIGDKPGLGKTLQAIGAVAALNAFPCLVICPASLKINWEKEWTKFSDHKAMILSDPIKETWPILYKAGIAKVFITNYESLGKYFLSRKLTKSKKPKLAEMVFRATINNFKSVIIDESHRVKDSSTLQAKYCKAICHGKEVIYLLSGTPAVNGPEDLMPQLSILGMLNSFGGIKTFKDRYCTAEYLTELHGKLRLNCFFSREKENVLKDLPAKVKQIVPCEITTRKEYDLAMVDLAAYLVQYKEATNADVRRAMKAQILVSFGVLKEISARGKIAHLVSYVEDVTAADEKVIIFCHLKYVAEELVKTFPDAVTILGKDNMHHRDNSITRFQTDPEVKIIICSIKAAGVGITLTASSRVVFIELPWTSADCEQCEDRAHRIGQKGSVQATYLLGENTIDQWIYHDVISSKRKMAQLITGAEHEVDEYTLDSLFNFLNTSR